MTTIIPYPPYALTDDILLVDAGADGNDPHVSAVLSRRYKRSDLIDQSSAADRAQCPWIFKRAKIRGIEVEFVDALLYENIWYVQYEEINNEPLTIPG